MPINPQRLHLNREQVWQWRRQFRLARLASPPTFDGTWRDYLLQQLQGLNLHNTTINTVAHADLEDETPLIDLIIMDTPSYGNP